MQEPPTPPTLPPVSPSALPGEALTRHRGFVRALAWQLVGSAEAEDVAQEVLLAGLEARPAPRAWRSWLATTVRNVACKFRRGRQRRGVRERLAAAHESLPATIELVGRVEIEQRVVEEVLALAEPDRSIVLLRFYERQPSAAIAARLRLQPDAVRTRLHRALKRLRARMEETSGGRSAWLAAVAPLLAHGTPGWPGTPLLTGPSVSSPSPVLAAGSAAAGVAVVSMSLKGVGLVAAACAAAVTAWWAVPEEWIPGVAVATLATIQGEHPKDPEAVPAVLPDVVVATRESLDPLTEESVASLSLASPVPLPPAGFVTFSVVDRDHGRAVESAGARFLSDRRYAEWDGSGEGRLKLTSGSWSGRLTAIGYEPADLPPFEITAGVTTELGTLALVRGDGCVEGRVTACHLGGNQPVQVELRGDGRGPCDECRRRSAAIEREGDDRAKEYPLPQPGDCCGYHGDLSKLEVRPGASFSFQNLAEGVYWLRAFEPTAGLVDVRRIDVARHQHAWVELDVSEPTLAQVELRHEDGAPFGGDWEDPHHGKPAKLRFSVRLSDSAHGEAQGRPEVADVQASVGPPIPMPESWTSSAARRAYEKALDLDALVALESRKVARVFNDLRTAQVKDWGVRKEVVRKLLAAAHGGANVPIDFAEDDRLDRERSEEDALVVDPAPPELDRVELHARRLRAELWEIGPLPRARLRLTVFCGNYRSDELELDLRLPLAVPFTVTMRLDDDVAARLADAAHFAQGPQSCAACHPDGFGEKGSTFEFREKAASLEELDRKRLLQTEFLEKAVRKRASGK